MALFPPISYNNTRPLSRDMFKQKDMYKSKALSKALIHDNSSPLPYNTRENANALQLFFSFVLVSRPHNQELQTALPQLCFLICLSSRASLLVRPHFSLIFSSPACLSSLICGAEQHKLTKNWLHSNFSANRTRVHLRGSSARSRLISSMSASLRWYFFS